MLLPAGASGSGQNGAIGGALSGIDTQPSVATKCTSAVGLGTAAGTPAGARRGPALELPSGSSAQLARPAAPASRDRRDSPRREARSDTASSLAVQGGRGIVVAAAASRGLAAATTTVRESRRRRCPAG